MGCVENCTDLSLFDLLRDSGLIEQMRERTRGLQKNYKIYGDGVFSNVGNIVSKHIGNTSREDRFENGIMTKIRIANEWAYGITENLFKILKWSYGLCIRACWDLEIMGLRMYCRIMMYCYSRWYKYDLQLDVNHI